MCHWDANFSMRSIQILTDLGRRRPLMSMTGARARVLPLGRSLEGPCVWCEYNANSNTTCEHVHARCFKIESAFQHYHWCETPSLSAAGNAKPFMSLESWLRNFLSLSLEFVSISATRPELRHYRKHSHRPWQRGTNRRQGRPCTVQCRSER